MLKLTKNETKVLKALAYDECGLLMSEMTNDPDIGETNEQAIGGILSSLITKKLADINDDPDIANGKVVYYLTDDGKDAYMNLN